MSVYPIIFELHIKEDSFGKLFAVLDKITGQLIFYDFISLVLELQVRGTVGGNQKVIQGRLQPVI